MRVTISFEAFIIKLKILTCFCSIAKGVIWRISIALTAVKEGAIGLLITMKGPWKFHGWEASERIVHSGLSIIDHVSVLEKFDGLKNHFLVVQHIVRYINIHTNECPSFIFTF